MALPFDPAQLKCIEYVGKDFTAIQIRFKDGRTQILEGDQITPEVRQYLPGMKRTGSCLDTPKDDSK